MDLEIKKSVKKLQRQFQDRSYTKYLQGKKVVIVGPDTRILGLKKGADIDGTEVIVRLNTTYDYIPFSEKMAEDIGHRTDVLYLAPSCLVSVIKNPVLLTRKLTKNKIQFINYQNGNKNSIYTQSPEYSFPEYKETFKKYLVRHPIVKTKLHYSHESCKELSRLLKKMNGKNCVARTGFLAIWDALVHGAESIQIEGMSFYHGGGHMFRKVNKLNPLNNHRDLKSPHNSMIEIKMLKILLKLYPEKIIIGDKNLKQLLILFRKKYDQKSLDICDDQKSLDICGDFKITKD